MIEQIALSQRSSPLTLVFLDTLKIQSAIAIMKMVEKESFVSERLKVQIPYVDGRESDFMEVIPDVDEEKHPILHYFILYKAKELNYYYDDYWLRFV